MISRSSELLRVMILDCVRVPVSVGRVTVVLLCPVLSSGRTGSELDFHFWVSVRPAAGIFKDIFVFPAR